MLKRTIRLVIVVNLVLAVPFIAPRQARAQDLGVIKEVITAAYSVYQTIKSLSEPSAEERLQMAVEKIISEMQSLHDNDIIDEVKGHMSTFYTLLETKDPVARQVLIGNFISQSNPTLAKLERIIKEQDDPGANRAYSVAPYYNALVSLTAIVLKLNGTSVESLFNHAIDANQTLLGNLDCTSQYDVYGNLAIRSVSYFPVPGKFYRHSLFEQNMPYSDNVYNTVQASNRMILQNIPSWCRVVRSGSLELRWISNGPPYTYDTCKEFGENGCIIWTKGYGEPPLSGSYCTHITESRAPAETTWGDNYLCSDIDLGMQWSSAGPLSNMDCVRWNEPSEPSSATWDDNYLCFPQPIASQYVFKWSHSGPIQNMDCTQITEPGDPYTWNDNYFCYVPKSTFSWRSYGKIPEKYCTQITESRESPETTWGDNYLCSDIDLGVRWSSAGPIPGMGCVLWNEPAEPPEATWNDNYLCFPQEVSKNYIFQWSYTGAISSMDCTQITESSDPYTWDDNYFCNSTAAKFVRDESCQNVNGITICTRKVP